MEISEKIKNGVIMYLKRDLTITQVAKELELDKKEQEIMYKILLKNGYKASLGLKSNYVIRVKKAVDEYLNTENPSLTKIGAKYHLDRHVISNRIKELNKEVINHQNRTKFDEHVFDSIDTEEKAYWLGFIYADGHIASQKEGEKSNYDFELSLKGSDIKHLNKFNEFMKHENPNHVKFSKTKCTNNGTICDRCRWLVRNRHLWETLNSYGCTPRKSLTLEFPDKSIFKSEDLIRHFIRGYFDGDGCLSHRDKAQLIPCISFLGTKNFLSEMQKYIIPIKNYTLYLKDKSTNDITHILKAERDIAKQVLSYLYNDSAIYLHRKYEKYLKYCRSNEKSFELLEGKIGESCDANTEVSLETKESKIL